MTLKKMYNENIPAEAAICNVPDIWLAHQQLLRAFVYQKLKNHDLTDDILQEVLLKVYRFCGSRKGVKNIRPWLFTIARNTIIDHQRLQKKFIYELPERRQDDDENLYKEAAEFIVPMLNFLPEKYALPLRLSDIERLKQQDIAQKLNLSLTATKSRVQRARVLLKNEFLTCFNLEVDHHGSLVDFKLKPQCLSLQHIVCCRK